MRARCTPQLGLAACVAAGAAEHAVEELHRGRDVRTVVFNVEVDLTGTPQAAVPASLAWVSKMRNACADGVPMFAPGPVSGMIAGMTYGSGAEWAGAARRAVRAAENDQRAPRNGAA